MKRSKVKKEAPVSVVMPTYNCEKHIYNTMYSIVSQTVKPSEIIVIDDCSNDNTVDVIKKFINEYDGEIELCFIELSQNKGVANARNIGIHESKYNYIAFVDSDDCWSIDKIEKQFYFMLKNNVDCSYTSYCIVNEDKKVIKKKINIPTSLDYEAALYGNDIKTSTMMVKKSVLNELIFKNVKHEDYKFILDLLKNNIKCEGINDVLMTYTKRKQSLSSSKIKSAIWTYKILKNEKNISLGKRIKCFTTYIVKGIKKYYL